ncbi:MAG TPA: thioesterase family protein [Candidatus Binatia bacterium]|nr:thioesterase family protein [Candidatus Binatia bacterium]
MSDWRETYRGTVFRWEVDANDHFTVAYYMARFGDAAVTMLHALGLGPAPTVDCYIRYTRELRVNDLMHVTTAVIAADADGLTLGHKLLESTEHALCTTVEHRLAVALTPEQRRALEARRAAWDAPAREARPRPKTLDGFHDTTRDAVKPGEVDAGGRLALPAAIHRFSAANGHMLAAFGLTPRYMRDNNRGFSTFEFQLGFEAGVRAGDPLTVRSALTHVGNSSMRILHVMTDERSGERVATLEQSGVQLDLDARRPAPLAPPLREQALALLVAAR